MSLQLCMKLLKNKLQDLRVRRSFLCFYSGRVATTARERAGCDIAFLCFLSFSFSVFT